MELPPLGWVKLGLLSCGGPLYSVAIHGLERKLRQDPHYTPNRPIRGQLGPTKEATSICAE
jgi:hypothetical protein